MALFRSPDYQTNFQSIGLSIREKKFNIDFQHGGHLGFTIRMILAIFDLRVTSILPMKLPVNCLSVQEKKIEMAVVFDFLL